MSQNKVKLSHWVLFISSGKKGSALEHKLHLHSQRIGVCKKIEVYIHGYAENSKPYEVSTCRDGPGSILFTVKILFSNPSAGTQCGLKQSVWLNGQLKQALLRV